MHCEQMLHPFKIAWLRASPAPQEYLASAPIQPGPDSPIQTGHNCSFALSTNRGVRTSGQATIPVGGITCGTAFALYVNVSVSSQTGSVVWLHRRVLCCSSPCQVPGRLVLRTSRQYAFGPQSIQWTGDSRGRSCPSRPATPGRFRAALAPAWS
jgi:hypothetical protein